MIVFQDPESNLRIAGALFTIGRKIVNYGCLVAPEDFQHRAAFKSISDVSRYHVEKWRKVLRERPTNHLVAKIIEILNVEGRTQDDFLRSFNDLAITAGMDVCTPSLNSYTVSEMENILKWHYQIHDPVTIMCVTKIWMVV